MATPEELVARIEALEAKVARLEDEKAVREVIARYGYTADGRSDQAWMDLWTDDGCYDLSSSITYPDGSSNTIDQRAEGREGLWTLITDPEGHHRPGFYGHSLHTGGDTVQVRIDGDQAEVHSYSRLYQETDGDVRLLSAASNRWLLRKVDGRWRLVERRRRQMGTDGFAENLPRGSD